MSGYPLPPEEGAAALHEDDPALHLSDRFSKVATPDLGIARRAIEKLHGPFHAHKAPLRTQGQVDIRATRCGQVAVGSFSFGRTIGIVPRALADAVVVTTATRGQAAIEIGGRTVAMATGATVVVHEEDAPVFLYRPDTEVLKLRFRRSRLEQFHALTRGVAAPAVPLRFDSVLDDGAIGARWVALLRFLVTTMNASSTRPASMPELNGLENMLMLTLLEGQPHNHAHQPVQDGRDRRVAFSRAVRFIEQHLARDLRLDDIADAACCSVRSLARAFSEAGKAPPMRFVHQLRLERIRAELQAQPGRGNIADLAFAWGYRHLGEFNRQYRAAFGETPTQTRDQILVLPE
jgi:AraC-like DNA-binding protein